jgi:hypothetical protein
MEIKIPSENYESLSRKIDSLNNKAQKLNLEPISLNIIYSIGMAIPEKNGLFKEVTFFNVKVDGEPPVLDGWKFVGIIEPTPEGNFVTEISKNYKIPDKYRHTDLCDCEHCGIKRDRATAFIVMNEETNEFLQVGRVCLKSYTKDTDPKNIALYESFFKLKEFAAVDTTRKVHPVYNVNEILAFCIKGKEIFPEYNGEKLLRIYFGIQDYNLFNTDYYKQLKEEKLKILLNINDETYDKVENFKNSILNLDSTNNNAIWNYQLAMKEKYTIKPYVLVESLEFKEAYDIKITLEEKKLKEELIRKQKQFEENEAKKQRVHVGNVGEKIQVKVTLDSVKFISNDFGGSLLYSFRDDNRNSINWFNSGKGIFSDDEAKEIIKEQKSFYIEGTVKKLVTYDNEPQTQLIRVKYLGENLELNKKSKNKLKTT